VRVSAKRRNAARSLVWSAIALQLSTECLLALAQHRHALPQLLDRQQFFLIGVKQMFNTFANMRQLPLQTLLTFSGWIRGARCDQPTIKFLLYQSWLFQQADHLSPDDLIEELLADEAAVVANRAAEFPPANRSQCTCSSESYVRWFGSMFARRRSHTSHS
jgi:hypothetical protein